MMMNTYPDYNACSKPYVFQTTVPCYSKPPYPILQPLVIVSCAYRGSTFGREVSKLGFQFFHADRGVLGEEGCGRREGGEKNSANKCCEKWKKRLKSGEYKSESESRKRKEVTYKRKDKKTRKTKEKTKEAEAKSKFKSKAEAKRS